MLDQLASEILKECQRRSIQRARTVSKLAAEDARNTRRSLQTNRSLDFRNPQIWSDRPSFHPGHVRKHHVRIARGIQTSLQRGSYAPQPCATIQIPKNNGLFRKVQQFSIADEAVSRLVYRSLLHKNSTVLSKSSFAYRNDTSPLDAIRLIQRAWSTQRRVFVCEFDFESYFDNVSHDYILPLLSTPGFYATGNEKRAIEAFLRHETADGDMRTRGFPQGTSVSLALANLALSPLDQALEEMPVRFARFADDTLVWSKSYQGVADASTQIYSWSEASGVPVNVTKSGGIQLLRASEEDPAEMKSVTSITFLNHKISLSNTTLSSTVVQRYKKNVCKVLFECLLREPLRGTQNLKRITSNDRDYVSAVWQLRRLAYGRMTERDVRRLRSTTEVPRARIGGLAAQYPAITDLAIWQELDEWTWRHLWLALRKRAALLGPKCDAELRERPEVWSLTLPKLRELKSPSSTSGETIDLRLPSLAQAHNLVAEILNEHGPEFFTFEGVSTASSYY